VGELESDLGKVWQPFLPLRRVREYSDQGQHNMTQANDEMNQHLSRGKVTKSGVAGLGTVGNVTLLLVFCLVVYYGASSYQSA
jgi:hypothetical protein